MCGVVGIIGTRDAAREAFLGLTTLQHRGQDAAGILTYDQGEFHRVKNIGLVDSVFTRENVETLTGSAAIGHARYATIGKGDISEVQPFLLSYPFGIGMVHNGNIVNVEELASDLKTRLRRNLLTKSDTEIVLNIFAEGLQAAPAEKISSEEMFKHICTAVKGIYDRVVGSYSIVAMIAGYGLIAFRDPNGIRPLVWGKRQNGKGFGHVFASESVALSFLGYELERDLHAGEVVFIDDEGNEFTQILAAQTEHHCMFEWVYFASPESVIDDVPVYGARINLGKNLGRLVKAQIASGKISPDIVVPVPETSRIAAIALSEELGIPYREVLIKNRYIKRTFILDSQEKRQRAVNLKLSPVKSEIEGKKVLLMDDSIVRGTTSMKIIELVRQAGAKEVYFVSTCPPIQHPCYYGIDFPLENELIAANRDLSAIEKALGADAVIYQDFEGLTTSVSRDGSIPCMACVDGKYPTDTRGMKKFAAQRSNDRAHDRIKEAGK